MVRMDYLVWVKKTTAMRSEYYFRKRSVTDLFFCQPKMQGFVYLTKIRSKKGIKFKMKTRKNKGKQQITEYMKTLCFKQKNLHFCKNKINLNTSLNLFQLTTD